METKITHLFLTRKNLICRFLLTRRYAAILLLVRKPTKKEMDYRKSSLYLIMIDESKIPKRDTIWENFPFSPIPEKYNDHNVKHIATNDFNNLPIWQKNRISRYAGNLFILPNTLSGIHIPDVQIPGLHG